jgi:hypothetical protein
MGYKQLMKRLLTILLVFSSLVSFSQVGSNYADTISNLASLRALRPVHGMVINMQGVYAYGDGGQGIFVWNDTATSAVITGWNEQCTGVTKGRFQRQYSGGPYNVKWFGAHGDGVTDDRPSIVAALGVIPIPNGTLYFPGGQYLVNTGIVINNGICLQGVPIFNYVTSTNVDYLGGSEIVTTNATPFTVIKFTPSGGNEIPTAPSIKNMFFYDKSAGSNNDTLLYIQLFNNSRVENCGFFKGKVGLVNDAGTQDASWSDFKGNDFGSNTIGFLNTAQVAAGGVPTIEVSGGQFIVLAGQTGFQNVRGTYVRLHDLKMDVTGPGAVGVLNQKGGYNEAVNLNFEMHGDTGTYAIKITGGSIKIVNATVNGDSTNERGISIGPGASLGTAMTNTSVIGGYFTNLSIGIWMQKNTEGITVSNSHFIACTAAIQMDTNSYFHIISDIVNATTFDGIPNGVINHSTQSQVFGYSFVSGGSFSAYPFLAPILSTVDRNALLLRPAQMWYNSDSSRFEFTDGLTIRNLYPASTMTIGGAITGATAGSVLFAGTGGILEQSNANFFWDSTNKRLAIGANSFVGSGVKLDIYGAYNANIPLLNLTTTDAQAATKGSGILFSGSYTGTTPTGLAEIQGLKENGSDGNYAGYLSLQSRINGGSMTEGARLTSGQHFLIGTSTDNAPLTVAGIVAPEATNTRDLGTSSFRWQNLYIKGVVGTITNDNATAGNTGEFVSSLIAVGSAVSLTTATPANVTSISLTAGDWDVDGLVSFTETTSTVTARSAGITSTSATVPVDGSEGYNGVQSTVTTEKNSIALGRKRFSLSGTTTIYLVGSATFSAGTCGGFGTITARRVR